VKPDRGLHELAQERAVPWGDAGQFAWHRARYLFAREFAAGRRVLDVGCGEGYGAALLAEVADDVIAVDYSPAAIDHAQKKYGRDNLAFRVHEATVRLTELGRFDLVVCFEVIEHLADPTSLVRTLADATALDGVCLVSTPNRLVDRAFEAISTHEHYEYHVGLLAPADLKSALRTQFADVRLLGQFVQGNAIHRALKSLDVLNLRHRVVRSPRAQHKLGSALGKPTGTTETAFDFSRRLVRQSPALLAVARHRS